MHRVQLARGCHVDAATSATRPMDLHFTPLEIVAVTIAILALAQVAQNGESHWIVSAEESPLAALCPIQTVH
jgi:Ca2+/H+ antiporter